MDGHAVVGDGRTLRRIIAMLVALAVLAERSAARSAPLRWFVLLVLRRAERAADPFVFEEAGLPPSIEPFAAAGNDPEDALRLAARFRALAAALGTLLPDACRIVRRPAPPAILVANVARGPGRATDSWIREPIDTS